MEPSLVLDARKLLDGGIGVYCRNLIDGIIALKRSGEVSCSLTLLCAPHAENSELASVLHAWQRDISVSIECSNKYSLEEYLGLAKNQQSVLASADVYHSPHYTLPFKIPAAKVVTVHDAIHVTHTQSWLKRMLGNLMIRNAIKRADVVTTVSEHSKKQLRALFPSNTKFLVTPNAPQKGICLRDWEEQPLGQKFCLYVGNSKPHKGLNVLLEAWGLLEQDLEQDLIPNLVVVSPDLTAVQQSLIDASAHCMHLKQVDLEQLGRLYNSTTALLMPSFEEGFGLPVLEALICRAPVVSFPQAAIAEYFRAAVTFTEDFSAASLAKSLVDVLEAPKSKLEELADEGVNLASGFSNERLARETVEAYEVAMSKVAEREGTTLKSFFTQAAEVSCERQRVA